MAVRDANDFSYSESGLLSSDTTSMMFLGYPSFEVTIGGSVKCWTHAKR